MRLMMIKRLRRKRENEANGTSVGMPQRIAMMFWLIVWASIVFYLWVAWTDLSPYIKWPLAILEAIFCPDEDMVKAVIRGKSQKN